MLPDHLVPCAGCDTIIQTSDAIRDTEGDYAYYCESCAIENNIGIEDELEDA